MSTEDEKLRQFEEHSRALLRESVENLDAETRSRLTRARFAALESLQATPGSVRWRAWVPAASVAGAAALAFLLWTQVSDREAPTVARDQQPALDDLDVLVADESFDLLEELEFYDWVEPAAGADDTDIS